MTTRDHQLTSHLLPFLSFLKVLVSKTPVSKALDLMPSVFSLSSVFPIVAFFVIVPLLSATGYAGDTTSKTNTSCSKTVLNILLTNDDGYSAAGINALYQGLNAVGHRVTLIAPETNASGSSASLTFSKIQLRQISETSHPASSRYAINGSPATSVILGVTGIYPLDKPPDLIISGINEGANLGPATPISGTVGATTAALVQLNPPLPAIAISTDPLSTDADSPKNQRHLDDVASFITRLVGALGQHRCATGTLLPTGLALNINYPPRVPADIEGLRVTWQSLTPYFSVSYRSIPDTEKISETGSKTTDFAPAMKKLSVESGKLNADTEAYYGGYITVVPITGNMSGNMSENFNSRTGAQTSNAKPSVLTQLQTLLANIAITTQ